MPEYVRVRVKSTGALIWVAEHSVNDSVEVLKDQPSRVHGRLLPTPKTELAKASSPKAPAVAVEDNPSPAPAGDSTAGNSGTKKEGSK